MHGNTGNTEIMIIQWKYNDCHVFTQLIFPGLSLAEETGTPRYAIAFVCFKTSNMYVIHKKHFYGITERES